MEEKTVLHEENATEGNACSVAVSVTMADNWGDRKRLQLILKQKQSFDSLIWLSRKRLIILLINKIVYTQCRTL